MVDTTDPDDVAAAVHRARETLRVERRRTVDEREALRAFRARVARLSPAPSSTGGSAGRGVPGVGIRTANRGIADGGTSAGSGLVAVRDAYVDTVMSVPHYEEEYDDTYESSLAAEFGRELALALTHNNALDERITVSLLDAVDKAIDERETFLDVLDAEAESIDRGSERLSAVIEEIATLARTDLDDLDYGALDAYRARTTTLEGECDSIAARRQRDVADVDRSLRIPDAAPDLPTYLYHELPVTYPVLATVGSVGDRLAGLRREIERELVRRT